MGSLVQNFKLLVAHPIDELRMRQQQREQPLGQRRHGPAALIAAYFVVATTAPFALALLAALPAGLPALPFALASAAAGTPPRLEIPRVGGLAVILETYRLIIEFWRRHVMVIGGALRACGSRGARLRRHLDGRRPAIRA